jgi:hypothetical protein
MGFAKGDVLQSFIILPIGYAIAVSCWLLPQKSRIPITPAPQPQSHDFPAAAPPSARRVRLVGGTRSKAGTPTRVNVSFRPRGFAFKWKKPQAGGFARSTGTTVEIESPKLVCGPCGKQFRIRGEGQLGARVVPCPQCGSALSTTANDSNVAVRKNTSWMPVVSVACKHCRGLIDVPYSSLGKSVTCPRCECELPIPIVNRRTAEDRDLSQLAGS